MKLLVLGGTGFVGQAFCQRCGADAGFALVIPSRRPAAHKAVAMVPGVTVVGADVHDDADLARGLEGVDAVVNLVAILHGREADFERAHVELPRRLARAMAAAGVRRLVHVSALGVPEGEASSAPSKYLRSKARGEAVLRTAAAQGTLDLTVLRPSVIFGAGDRFLNLFAALQSVFPVMPLGGASARFQPVWVGDVAQALERGLADPATVGRTYECVGPKVWTLAELVRLAGAAAGVARPIVPLPEPLARLQALALSCLPGEPLMSTDNIDSMRVPNVATGRWPDLRALGLVPAAVESVAPRVLARGPTRLDEFRSRT